MDWPLASWVKDPSLGRNDSASGKDKMPQMVTNLLKLARETENIQMLLQAIFLSKVFKEK